MRPPDLPTAEHYPHGSRARYVTGCRCDDCRRANREYSRIRTRAQRKGDWNGLVDAEPVRRHLQALSRVGVGYKAVASASDVGKSALRDILSGRKKLIRARSAKKVLEVDRAAISDRALISPRQTHWLIRQLLRRGVTKTEIAERLYPETKNPKLQFCGKKVRAKTAQRIRKLHKCLMEELELGKEAAYVCCECGYSHRKEDRLRHLKSVLPARTEDLAEAWPCFYGGGPHSPGERKLNRDLHDLGAKDHEGEWHLRENRHDHLHAGPSVAGTRRRENLSRSAETLSAHEDAGHSGHH